jgi:hypothetical protein
MAFCVCCGQPLGADGRCPQGHVAPYSAPPPSGFFQTLKTVFSRRLGEATRLAGDSEAPAFIATGAAFTLGLSLLLLALPLRAAIGLIISVGRFGLEIGPSVGTVLLLVVGSALPGAIIFFGLAAMMAALCAVCGAPARFKSILNSVGAALTPLACGAAAGFLAIMISAEAAVAAGLVAVMAAPVPILLYTDLRRRAAPDREPVWLFVIANAITGLLVGVLVMAVLDSLGGALAEAALSDLTSSLKSNLPFLPGSWWG